MSFSFSHISSCLILENTNAMETHGRDGALPRVSWDFANSQKHLAQNKMFQDKGASLRTAARRPPDLQSISLAAQGGGHILATRL